MNKIVITITTVALLIIAGTIVIKKPMMTNSSANIKNQQMAVNQQEEKLDFTGEKGETINMNNNEVKISTNGFETNKIRFFNTTLSDSKTIYYLILKDKDGNYRVAANANQQCAKFGKGYKQEGDKIICITCQKLYSVEDFAKTEPDCNPKPINPKAKILDNQIVISQPEFEKVANLF